MDLRIVLRLGGVAVQALKIHVKVVFSPVNILQVRGDGGGACGGGGVGGGDGVGAGQGADDGAGGGACRGIGLGILL